MAKQMPLVPLHTQMKIVSSHSDKANSIAAWALLAVMYLLMGLTFFLIWQKANGQ